MARKRAGLARVPASTLADAQRLFDPELLLPLFESLKKRAGIQPHDRWLKCMAGFKHFYSESRAGMTIQMYIALIGTLLIALETGAKPTKYAYAMMTHVASGATSLKGALKVIEKRQAERARAAESMR